MGNYDASGLWLIDRYQQPFSTVMERLEPRSLFDRFIASMDAANATKN